MEKNDKVFYFFVAIREKLKNILSEVQDSVPYGLSIKYIKSTSEHEVSIKNIITEVADFIKEYGLFYVDVYHHSDYEAVFDSKEILGDYYEMSQLKDKILYSMYDELYYDRTESIKCPLCKKNRKFHKISKGYLLKAPDSFCVQVKDFLNILYEAAENCVYNGKRSAIREKLLKALIAINDIIMPESVDEYILKRKG